MLMLFHPITPSLVIAPSEDLVQALVSEISDRPTFVRCRLRKWTRRLRREPDFSSWFRDNHFLVSANMHMFPFFDSLFLKHKLFEDVWQSSYCGLPPCRNQDLECIHLRHQARLSDSVCCFELVNCRRCIGAELTTGTKIFT